MLYSELVNKTVEEIGNTAYGIVVDQLILDKNLISWSGWDLSLRD
jgi:hypothetical protein